MSREIVKKALAAGTAAALVLAVPVIKSEEGRSLVAYPDVGGVWTICDGQAQGVKKDDRKTDAECDALTLSRASYFMDVVDAAVKPELPDYRLAALTVFAYNIGTGNFLKSKTLRLLNAGRPLEACVAMMGWYRAGGKDCRIRSNNCYGLILRRERERNMCLGGSR